MSLILGNGQISNARVLYANGGLKQLGNVFLSGLNFLSLTTLVIIYNRTQAELACSRLRDSGEKLFSKKKCEKRVGAGERQGGEACTHFFNGLFRYISS